MTRGQKSRTWGKTHPDLLEETILFSHFLRHFVSQLFILVERFFKDTLEPLGPDGARPAMGETSGLFEHVRPDIVPCRNLAAVGGDSCSVSYTVVQLFERGAERADRGRER